MGYLVERGTVENDGTGDPLRTAFNKTNGAIAGAGVSVELFGADATGLTDSTAAFEEAIAEVGYRGTLSIPRGTYLVSQLAITKSDFSIRGDGTLLCSGPVNAWVTIDGSNVAIEGVAFDGNNQACTLLNTGNANANWKLRRATFKNASANDDNDAGKTLSANGFLFRKGMTGLSIDECRFENITYDGQRHVDGVQRFCAGIYGVTLSGASAADHLYKIRISDCEFYGIGTGKIDADAIRIQGYDITLASGIVITDCEVFGCGHRAIKLLIGGAVVAKNFIYSEEPGPVVTRAMFSGISTYGSNCVIDGNVFMGGACYRMIEADSTSLGRVENITIKGNVLTLPTPNGTYDPQADSDGIFLGSIKGASVSGNTVRNARIGINLKGLCEGVSVGVNTLLDLGLIGVYGNTEASGTYAGQYPTNCSVSSITADGFTSYGVQFDAGCTKIAIVGTQTDGGGFGAVNRGVGVTGKSAANFGELVSVIAETTNASYYARLDASTSNPHVRLMGPFENSLLSYNDSTAVLSVGRTTGTVTLNNQVSIGGTIILKAGTGSPEGVLTAARGSVWFRTDGGAATSFYVKESGAGNTGWVAK